MLASRLLACVALSVFVVAACGGKTIGDLDASDDATQPTPTVTSTPPTPTFDSGGRVCPPNCAVGHQCCDQSCGGIPVAMPSDCCSCLPGEVDSTTCSGGKCGT